MTEFLQFTVNGLMNGTVYALVAVGLVAVYKSTRVVNFAHGHIIMFGAYVFYTFTVLLPRAAWVPAWYRDWQPQWLADRAATVTPFTFDAAVVSWIAVAPRLVVALAAAIVLNAALGVVIDRVLMRRLYGASHYTLIILTIGLISILDGLVSIFWASTADFVPHLGPHGAIWIDLFGGSIFVFGSSVMNFAIACLLFGSILALFFLTRIGVTLRATAEDHAVASSMGINVPRVFSGSWALACATGAVAGAILASRNGVSPTIATVGLAVLAIALMGGLDSFAGVAIASLAFGWLEAAARQAVGAEYAEILPYAAVLLVILVRPQGLLGRATIDRV